MRNTSYHKRQRAKKQKIKNRMRTQEKQMKRQQRGARAAAQ